MAYSYVQSWLWHCEMTQALALGSPRDYAPSCLYSPGECCSVPFHKSALHFTRMVSSQEWPHDMARLSVHWRLDKPQLLCNTIEATEMQLSKICQ